MPVRWNEMKLFLFQFIMLVVIGCSFQSTDEGNFKNDIVKINAVNQDFLTSHNLSILDSFQYRYDIVSARITYSTEDNIQLALLQSMIVNDTAAEEFYFTRAYQMKNTEERSDKVTYLGKVRALEIKKFQIKPSAPISILNKYDRFEEYLVSAYDKKNGVDVVLMRILYGLKVKS